MFLTIRVLAVSTLLMAGLSRCEALADDSTTTGALSRAVRQLEAEDFAVRREARALLEASGGAAVPPLIEAARQADPQLAGECVSLLAQLATSTDESIAAAAKAGLETLAADTTGEAARLAAQVLAPPQPLVDPNSTTGGRRAIAVQFGFRAAFPGGDRQAEFEDEGRKILLKEAANGGITVRITAPDDNGQPQVTEHAAANIVELRQKSREAFDLYVRNRHRLGVPAPFVPAAPAAMPFGAVGGLRQMRVQVINGRREVEITENGRRTEITDDQGRNIRARVTETVNGQEVTRTIEAADVAQLRLKDPALAAMLEGLGTGMVGRPVIWGGGFGQ